MSDPRPVISSKLKELETQLEVQCPWPNPEMTLTLTKVPESMWYMGWVIFVHRGRFGLGIFVEKDGPRVGDCRWADGRGGPEALYAHDIRAIVVGSSPPLPGFV
jgi:hypothetical protein